MLMRTALLWDITQRRVVILYRRFWTIYLIIKGQEVQEEKVDFLTLEDGTDMLSRNVGKGLPLDAA
jgi:hypothetical protein